MLALQVLAVLIGLSSAMFWTKSTNFELEDNHFQYLAKFAVGEEDLGKFRFRAKIERFEEEGDFIHDINLVLMNDKEWEASLDLESCEER